MMYICELCGATCEGTPPDPEVDECPVSGWMHEWINELEYDDEALEE